MHFSNGQRSWEDVIGHFASHYVRPAMEVRGCILNCKGLWKRVGVVSIHLISIPNKEYPWKVGKLVNIMGSNANTTGLKAHFSQLPHLGLGKNFLKMAFTELKSCHQHTGMGQRITPWWALLLAKTHQLSHNCKLSGQLTAVGFCESTLYAPPQLIIAFGWHLVLMHNWPKRSDKICDCAD